MIPRGGLPTHTIAEDQARAKLEEIARKHLQGVENQLLILLGNPAASILSAAADFVADVIVMATHGRTGFSRAFFGSIAEEVLREAPCPVLTVHSSTPMFDHIFARATSRYAVKRSVAVPRTIRTICRTLSQLF
jgi:hypothetical protein